MYIVRKMYTTVRLDKVAEDDASRLHAFLDSLDTKIVVYEEVADITKKIHWQGYIECTQESYEVYKEAFLEIFRPTHSRYQRSFTVVRKVETYMIYVAKDKNLFYSKGVTEEELKEKEDASYKKKKRTAFMTVVKAWWVSEPKQRYQLRAKIDDSVWDLHNLYQDLRDELAEHFNLYEKVWDLPITERYVNHLISDIYPVRRITRYLDHRKSML